MIGGLGSDQIVGGAGVDSLFGIAGDDGLYGGDGNDGLRDRRQTALAVASRRQRGRNPGRARAAAQGQRVVGALTSLTSAFARALSIVLKSRFRICGEKPRNRFRKRTLMRIASHCSPERRAFRFQPREGGRREIAQARMRPHLMRWTPPANRPSWPAPCGGDSSWP
jgi:hypothetical protein